MEILVRDKGAPVAGAVSKGDSNCAKGRAVVIAPPARFFAKYGTITTAIGFLIELVIILSIYHPIVTPVEEV